MNWDQFKCSLYCLCLGSAVLASLPLTQEVVGLNAVACLAMAQTQTNVCGCRICKCMDQKSSTAMLVVKMSAGVAP